MGAQQSSICTSCHCQLFHNIDFYGADLGRLLTNASKACNGFLQPYTEVLLLINPGHSVSAVVRKWKRL